MDIENWDWDIGKRKVADFAAWQERFSYLEEPCASPDGESIAAIIRNDDEEFTVSTQKSDQAIEIWENSYDKVWSLRYGPDARLSALISDTGEWTVSTDDTPWENTYDFAWDMTITSGGGTSGRIRPK